MTIRVLIPILVITGLAIWVIARLCRALFAQIGRFPPPALLVQRFGYRRISATLHRERWLVNKTPARI